jgi:hypothetical protein
MSEVPVNPFSTSSLSPEELTAIGSVAVDSALLEQLLGEIIWLLLGLSEELGCVVTDGRTIGPRAGIMRDILHALTSEDDRIRGQWKRLHDAIDKLVTDRNAVIHGHFVETVGPAWDDGTNWDDGTSWDDSPVHKFLENRRRGKAVHSVKVEEALEIASRLSNASTQVVLFYREHASTLQASREKLQQRLGPAA